MLLLVGIIYKFTQYEPFRVFWGTVCNRTMVSCRRAERERGEMAKRVLVLNGAPRKGGQTSELVRAFVEGARFSGHEVDEYRLYDLDIRGCVGCLRAEHDAQSPCAIKDDMEAIYSAFASCDVVAFASPVYFWTVTGPLKTVADRLYAELECLGYGAFARESVLIMTAGGSDYSQALAWYRTYERNLGWKSLGEVLGADKTAEARRLGASL